MTDSVQPSRVPLPPDEALQVERLCTHFEAAWQQGERPHGESYRSEVSEAVWPALLRELLALEMDYRLLDAVPPGRLLT